MSWQDMKVPSSLSQDESKSWNPGYKKTRANLTILMASWNKETRREEQYLGEVG